MECWCERVQHGYSIVRKNRLKVKREVPWTGGSTLLLPNRSLQIASPLIEWNSNLSIGTFYKAIMLCVNCGWKDVCNLQLWTGQDKSLWSIWPTASHLNGLEYVLRAYTNPSLALRRKHCRGWREWAMAELGKCGRRWASVGKYGQLWAGTRERISSEVIKSSGFSMKHSRSPSCASPKVLLVCMITNTFDCVTWWHDSGAKG